LCAYPLPCDCPQTKEAERARQTQQAEIDKRLREKARRDAIARAGLVGKLADYSLDSFERRKDWPGAIDCAVKMRTYWQAVYNGQFGSKPWLVMCGEYGTGKTHLAAGAIREAVLAGWGGVYFRSWTEYLSRLQRSWDDDDGERTGDITDELKRGKFVAIDDIDKRESPSGWAPGELYAALNHRYNMLMPTILTFNCTLQEPDPKARGRLLLERYMTRATIDRMIGAAFAIVDFNGPSYRSSMKW
jgi:DNA replication protein DnaC